MLSPSVAESPSPAPAQAGDRAPQRPHDGSDTRSLAEEHAILLAEVRSRHRAVLAGLAAGRWPHAELVALVTYLRYEVLDQAVTEERLLFPIARQGTTDSHVHDLTVEHLRIRDLTDRLADLAAAEEPLGEPTILVDLLDHLDEFLEAHMQEEESVLSAGTGVESLRRPFRCHLWFPITEGPELDLDSLPRRFAPRAAMERLSRLRPGECVHVRSSEDLQSLWALLSRAQPGEFGWIYLDEGPQEWRATITRRSPA
jgi:uncharacterized protein (DUF2249 family)